MLSFDVPDSTGEATVCSRRRKKHTAGVLCFPEKPVGVGDETVITAKSLPSPGMDRPFS